jgi:hypothetical protein
MGLALVCVLNAGCSKGPQKAGPVDERLARQCLNAALESWKKGEAIGELRNGSPSVVVQDMDWKTGYALVAYELTGEDRTDDCNLHCPVTVTLRDPKGKEVSKKVTYVIGTDPIITVFREMHL